nr:hypothetical protein [Variovorax sp. PAMC26660]
MDHQTTRSQPIKSAIWSDQMKGVNHKQLPLLCGAASGDGVGPILVASGEKGTP